MVAGLATRLTPGLTDGLPMTYTRDGETVNQLESEIDHAFTLVNALDSTQQREAIVDAGYVDLAWGPTQDGRATVPVGIRADTLTASPAPLPPTCSPLWALSVGWGLRFTLAATLSAPHLGRDWCLWLYTLRPRRLRRSLANGVGTESQATE